MKIPAKSNVQVERPAEEKTPATPTTAAVTKANADADPASLALIGAAPAVTPIVKSADPNVTTRLHRIAALGAGLPPQRFAAIDLGSSSVKMLVEERGEDGKLRVLTDVKIGCALGKDVPENGAIPEANMQRAIDALKQLLGTTAQYGIDPAEIPMITTAVVRNSTNGEDFADRIRHELGLAKLKVLSGDDEAEIGFKGALAMMHGAKGNYATLDLGGGSFQLAIGTEARLEDGGSTQIGSNYVVQNLLASEILTPQDFATADAKLQTVAPMPMPTEKLAGRTLVATGGISKFLRAHLGKDVIGAAEIDALRKSMGAIGFDARVPLIQAGKDAATQKALGVDTVQGARDYGIKLVASSTLLLHILKGIGVSEVRVSETDARHALILAN